jgi:hypothetical protein
LLRTAKVSTRLLSYSSTIFSHTFRILYQRTGAPVSVVLTSLLFDHDILSRSQRIGILTMAGAHHGTFEEMGRYMQEAAEELHSIADPNSPTFSQLYAPAMRKILTFGVLLICVASFEDKVITLSSALADGLHHPNIYRAL